MLTLDTEERKISETPLQRRFSVRICARCMRVRIWEGKSRMIVIDSLQVAPGILKEGIRSGYRESYKFTYRVSKLRSVVARSMKAMVAACLYSATRTQVSAAITDISALGLPHSAGSFNFFPSGQLAAGLCCNRVFRF